MDSNRCPFCEQGNSATSKVCGACGAALNPDWDIVTSSLVPCPRCGAVNDQTATSCYQCRGTLLGLRSDHLALDELAPSTPPAGLSNREPNSPAASTTPAADSFERFLDKLGSSPNPRPEQVAPSSFDGEVFRPRRDEHAAPSPAAGKSRPSPVKLDPLLAAAVVKSSPRRSLRRMIAGSAAVLAVVVVSALAYYQRQRSIAEAIQAPAASRSMAAPDTDAASTRPKPISKAGERSPSSQACDEGAAALDLCEPIQKNKAETAAANKAATARTEAIDASKAGKHEQLRPPVCTDAAAALGLCTPESAPRK